MGKQTDKIDDQTIQVTEDTTSVTRFDIHALLEKQTATLAWINQIDQDYLKGKAVALSELSKINILISDAKKVGVEAVAIAAEVISGP